MIKETNLIELTATEIIDNGIPHDVNEVYTLILHNKDSDIVLDTVESVEVVRNYTTNIGDYVIARFHIHAGDFKFDIYDYKDNLEMTIIKKSLDTQSQERFKFVLLNNLVSLEGGIYTRLDRDQLNHESIVTVEGQCIPMLIYAMRQVNSDGIYRTSSVNDLIRGTFNNALNALTINCEVPTCGTDVYPPINNRIYDMIQIPTGTNVLDIPSYLQNGKYGVYNGDIGTYIQQCYDRETNEYKNIFFVYPLYSSKRFAETDNKLIIYKVEHNKYNYIDRTHSIDGGIVKIITGTDSHGTDDGVNDLNNTGHVIAKTVSNSIMTAKQNVTDKELTTDKLNTIVAEQFMNMADGNKKHMYIGTDDNAFKYRSTVVFNTMARYQITWNYSDADLIYPGMPVMYIFNDLYGGIQKLTGTVTSVFERANIGLKTKSAILIIHVLKPVIVKNLEKNNET